MNRNVKTIDNILSVYSEIDLFEVVKAKKWLRKYHDSHYVPFSHISYIINTIPEKNLKKFIDIFSVYVNTKNIYKAKICNIEIDNNFAYLPLKADELFEVHKELLEIINNLREGFVRKKDLVRYNRGHYSTDEFNRIKKYGFRFVLNNFNSHITLGKIGTKDPVNTIKKLHKMLAPIVNSEIVIGTITANYHTASEDHAKSKIIWKETYTLV